MRWRTLEEVKAGKGKHICANVACGRVEGLEGSEVVFGYMEDGRRHDVLVTCVLCEKCGRKLRKARGGEENRKRKRSHERSRHNSRHNRRLDETRPVEEKEAKDPQRHGPEERSEGRKRARSKDRERERSRRSRNSEHVEGHEHNREGSLASRSHSRAHNHHSTDLKHHQQEP